MKTRFLLLVLFFFFPLSGFAVTNSLLALAAPDLLMQDLHLTATSVPTVISQEILPSATSDHISLTLGYPGFPPLRLFMSGPKGFWHSSVPRYPVIFLIAGFFTGAYNSLLLGEVDNTVMVSVDYPYEISAMAQDPSKLLQSFRLTPGVVALALKWLSQQSWMRPEQSVAMGVSLGGLFLPAGLRLAQQMQAAPPRAVFAFTGAEIKIIVENVLKGYLPAEARGGLGELLPALNVLNDPKLHLPFLRGSFLVLAAAEDQLIPAPATQALYDLLPGQKNLVILPGRHIDYDQNVQIQQTKEAILNWL